MKWIPVSLKLPRKKERVLMYYRKNKEYVITEGYLTDTAEDTASDTHDVDFWRSNNYGLTWFDTQRQIQSLSAKNSKNEVLFWSKLPVAPIL